MEDARNIEATRKYRREYMRRYRVLNHEKVREAEIRSFKKNGEKQRVARYGLTLEAYDKLLASQGGSCAICGGPPCKKLNGARQNNDVVPKYVVDHCHVTGAVRGLLCSFCNRMLGQAKDSPANLRSAAHYLEKRRGAN